MYVSDRHSQTVYVFSDLHSNVFGFGFGFGFGLQPVQRPKRPKSVHAESWFGFAFGGFGWFGLQPPQRPKTTLSPLYAAELRSCGAAELRTGDHRFFWSFKNGVFGPNFLGPNPKKPNENAVEKRATPRKKLVNTFGPKTRPVKELPSAFRAVPNDSSCDQTV